MQIYPIWNTANSRTLQDNDIKFPELSRTYIDFQNFPGPWKGRKFQNFPNFPNEEANIYQEQKTSNWYSHRQWCLSPLVFTEVHIQNWGETWPQGVVKLAQQRIITKSCQLPCSIRLFMVREIAQVTHHFTHPSKHRLEQLVKISHSK